MGSWLEFLVSGAGLAVVSQIACFSWMEFMFFGFMLSHFLVNFLIFLELKIFPKEECLRFELLHVQSGFALHLN